MYYIKKKKKEPSVAKNGQKRGKPDLVRQLDDVFSKYIRLRDAMPNGYCRCISCGQIKPFHDFDAGHFYSRKHMGTRFDEDNVWAEWQDLR